MTAQEFEQYYSNVSSSIDDDDYFELMMRNAWHITGGEGWCANSSNRRVLVTHADGSQSVEEVKNDLGVKVRHGSGGGGQGPRVKGPVEKERFFTSVYFRILFQYSASIQNVSNCCV